MGWYFQGNPEELLKGEDYSLHVKLLRQTMLLNKRMQGSFVDHIVAYHAFFAAVFQDWMYITDWRLDSIIKLHKLNGDTEEVVAREPQNNRLYGVESYSKSEQDIKSTHSC